MSRSTGGDPRCRHASDDTQSASVTVGTAAAKSGELLCRQQPCWLLFRAVQILAAQRQDATAVTVGEKAEVTDLDEPGWQHVQQEAAEELHGIEAHDLDTVVVSGVAPAEAHLTIGETQQSTVSNGDTMSVTGQILENMGGPAEGRLGVNHPSLTT
jgi:hypothetical protein